MPGGRGDQRVKSMVFDLLDSDGDGLISIEVRIPMKLLGTCYWDEATCCGKLSVPSLLNL